MAQVLIQALSLGLAEALHHCSVIVPHKLVHSLGDFGIGEGGRGAASGQGRVRMRLALQEHTRARSAPHQGVRGPLLGC